MTSPDFAYADEAAAVHFTGDPDGRPVTVVTGTRPAPAGEFAAWSAAIASLAGVPGLGGVLGARLDERGHAVFAADASGATLAERLVATGPVPVAEAAGMFAVLARGLAALHAKGLRHGGITPSTVITVGPRLAGLDAGAPGLLLPIRPHPFAPLETPHRSSDVYALAATAYTALGGRLPFAAEPADPAARRQISGDLTGVPVELTALLRGALHPDPARRPAADALAEGFGAFTAVPTGVGGIPMAAADIGSPVRPVNDAVASINLAVAGAAATGIAATAGILAGRAAGDLLTGAGGAAGKAASAFGASTVLKVGAGVAGAALVAAAVVVGVNVLDEDPQGTGGTASGPGPMDEAIRGFDVSGAAFSPGRVFSPDVDEEPTEFSGGRAPGALGDPSQPSDTYVLEGDPVYADLDGDNDLDLAQWVTVQAGGGPKYLYFWEWDGAKAVQSPYVAVHEQDCGGAVESLEPGADGGVEVVMDFTFRCGDADPAGDDGPGSITLGLRDHLPVQLAPGFGAAGNCYDSTAPNQVHTDLTGRVTPLLIPVEGSPVVGAPEEFTAIESAYWDLGGGTSPWHLARLTRTDGSVACGWIPPGTIA
ncbi:hypothetical protein [Phytomonospora endophytica]|uniref:Protein kinase domain-containing protein n=1 Tax=Phytomonospora endophytica TaxID=714109 RepID=A0A841FTD4_9ACTN|nr:hypothetical protein [Phytomonospora endophytica]MBB6035240.1 hypothetical protein [Phytomonospora endophytica]GIG64011.1 hypothetical protein Pen01_03060 [Phytomonospora endophytica]